MTERVSVFTAPDLIALLSGEPELLAIADAIAETRPEVSRERPRKRVLLLAATIALVVVGSAVAVGSQFVDFSGQPAAPAHVAVRFAELDRAAPARMGPGVVASEARELSQLQLSDGSTAAVWLAPTTSGGFCVEIESLAVGCDTRREVPFEAGFAARRLPEGPAVVYGSALDTRATSVQVTLADGQSFSTPVTLVSAPIDAGFYVHELKGLDGAFPLTVALKREDEVIATKVIGRKLPADLTAPNG